MLESVIVGILGFVLTAGALTGAGFGVGKIIEATGG